MNKKSKPRIAIIGAGIFGVSCALELQKVGEVYLFDKNKDIFQEASFVNQYRHHWGYHYPRSSETVIDIKKAIDDFEKIYNDAVIRNFPTYYGLAKEGSKISSEQYIDFCQKHKLPYELVFPSKEFMNRRKLDICLKTLEPIYSYKNLKKIALNQIAMSKNIFTSFKSLITNMSINQDGTKKLKINDSNSKEFDIVINATYANVNKLAHWLNFKKKEIRLDLVESLIVKLDIPMISLAVMDGPFTNLVPTGEKNIFTLVHISESILHRFVPHDGLIPDNLKKVSRHKSIIKKSSSWFPILKNSKLIESRYVFRSVNAFREHDDARPSDIIEHGSGCWSIMGGKILNSVKVSKDISKKIESQLLY